MNKKILKFGGKKYYVTVGNYPTDKLAMFVTLTDSEDEDAVKYEMYTDVLTVNLGTFYRPGSFVQHGCSFINANAYNFASFIAILNETGLAKPYVLYGAPFVKQSGFVQYPLFEFDLEKLKEYDPEGVKKYSEAWAKECKRQQKKMMNSMMKGGHYGW